MLFNAGIWSGIGAVSLKLVGELFQSHQVMEHWFLSIFLAAIMITSVFAITHSTNMAMKFYDQLEVMPTFMAMVMVLWMSSGMLILQEVKFYTGT